jgi:hypothetical protein
MCDEDKEYVNKIRKDLDMSRLDIIEINKDTYWDATRKKYDDPFLVTVHQDNHEKEYNLDMQQ